MEIGAREGEGGGGWKAIAQDCLEQKNLSFDRHNIKVPVLMDLIRSLTEHGFGASIWTIFPIGTFLFSYFVD